MEWPNYMKVKTVNTLKLYKLIFNGKQFHEACWSFNIYHSFNSFIQCPFNS